MVLKTADTELERLMREGQAAAKRGDKVMARALLTQLLERDPHNEQGWMWLSGAVTDAVEQQTCLENVLILNPGNQQARRGLEFLGRKTGMSRAPVPYTSRLPEQAAAPAPPPAPLSPTSAEMATPPQAAASAAGAPTNVGPFDPAALEATQGASPTAGAVAEQHVTSPELTSILPAGMPFGDFSLDDLPPGSLPPWEQPNSSDVTISVVTPPPLPSLTPVPEAAEAAKPAIEAPAKKKRGSAQKAAPVAAEASAAPTPPPAETDVPEWVKEIAVRSAPVADTEDGTAEDEQLEKPAAAASSTVPAEQHDEPVEAAAKPNAPEVDEEIGDWLGQLASGATPSSSQQPAASQRPTPGPFGSPGADFAALGPFSSAQLPAPEELPGGDHGSEPWYVHSSQAQHGSADYHGEPGYPSYISDPYAENEGKREPANVTLIKCPNCTSEIADTNLMCPECRYAFFVHCPHCHELIDTGDARPGQIDGCQYCGTEVNRFELGQVDAHVSMPAMAIEGEKEVKAWVGEGLNPPERKRGLSLGWLADLAWLVAVVLLVWALTQLPAWLHLTAMY